MLKTSLEWRRTFGVAGLAPEEFESDLQSGRMYVSGHDTAGRPVLVIRKRADRMEPTNTDGYLRFLVFSLESAARAMQGGAEQWVWIMDMAGYSRANSPPLSVSLATLRIFANQYPERLHRVYFVDAPPVFSLLFGALKPFIDPVTAAKIAFLKSAELKQKMAGAQDSSGSSSGSGSQAGASTVATATATIGVSCAGGFESYWNHYTRPFAPDDYRRLLGTLWGTSHVQPQAQH